MQRYPIMLALLLLVSSLIPLNLQAKNEQVLQVHQVSDTVYALVGPTTNRAPENLGNNATFGFIITDEGVILIDTGGSLKGAQMIESAIRTVTDKPVTIVINTGGQDHRWFGNSYFKQQGARIIASNAAVADQQERLNDQLIRISNLVGDSGMEGTEPLTADETFDEHYSISLGGINLELHHVGAAHTPGDAYVWLPEQKVLFSGDIIYIQRMLGVGSQSTSSSWLTALESIAALQPKVIIPGHGPVTDLERATRESYDYLVFLRDAVREFMDDGGTMDAISEIDQSAFSFLENYDTLKGRNAQKVFSELEWE